MNHIMVFGFRLWLIKFVELLIIILFWLWLVDNTFKNIFCLTLIIIILIWNRKKKWISLKNHLFLFSLFSFIHQTIQDAVINELKNKTNAVREKKLLQQDEVYNGALEDILLGLKSEPYRRADAVRRSQRRRIDNNRLSRTMEEIEM